MTLSLDRASYRFPGGVTALRGVTAAIPPGALTCVLGQNGSGKTTLLRLLAGLIRPDEGAALLDGAPVAALRERERAKKLAYLPQHAQAAFDLPVRESVLLGRMPYLGAFGRERAHDVQLCESALARTGLSALAGRMLSQLSGGEARRAALARALCQQTPILLLDEPVAGLDIAQQLRMMRLCRALAGEGKTVVCVMHDINLTARFAGHVLLLRGGELLAQGPPGETLTPPLLLAAYGVHARALPAPERQLFLSDEPIDH